MRELHVVATSGNGRHVMLAAQQGAERGEYGVAIDRRLSAAMRGELAGEDGRSPSDGVTPKQIQARLRAGESSEQIAESAGVPVERIERFAGPVEGERQRMIDEVQKAVSSRPRLGPSVAPLGEAVDQHLAKAPGYRPERTVWSSRREPWGTWLVELTFVARAKNHTAIYRYDPHTREVEPMDSPSALLAHVTEIEDPHEIGRAPAARVTTAPARGRTTSSGSTTAGARAKRPAGASVAAPGKNAAGKKASSQSASNKGGRTVRAAAPEIAAARNKRRAPSRAQAPKVAVKAQAPAPSEPVKVTRPPAPAAAATPARAIPTRAIATRAKAAKARTAAAQKKSVANPVAAELEPTGLAVEEQGAVAATPTEQTPSSPPTLRVVASGDNAEKGRPDEDVDEAAVPPTEADAQPEEQEAPQAVPVRRAAGERATVPAWADVLFGTARVTGSDRGDGAKD